MKIGLLIIATNKYINFVNPLLNSADEWFLKDHDVTYFVFTNQEISNIETKRNIKKIETVHKNWPFMTLERYKLFFNSKEILSEMDYLYYCDADMRFVNNVGDEILSDLVATQHPGHYERRGTPETNPNSLACVYPHENMQYFAGGFNGGNSKEFLKMSETLSNNIDNDYSRGIIAIWHDESHLNRYMIDNVPTKILDPSYCYPESWSIPFDKKLLALDKNHSEYRTP